MLLLVGGAAGALSALAAGAAGHRGALPADRSALEAVRALPGSGHAALDVFAHVLPPASPPLAAAVAVLLLLSGRQADAAFCLLAPACCLAGTTLLKPWVARPASVTEGWMFPSGHVTAVAAVAFTLALLLRPGRGLARPAGRAALLALPLLSALGTVAGRHHHMSDVVGALLLCGVVVPLVALAVDRLPIGASP